MSQQTVAKSASIAPGSKLLKVTGILMIIFGALVLLLAILAAAAVGAIASLEGAGAAAVGFFATLLAFVPGILEFIAGILGVANANKPQKAMICLIFGGLIIVLNLIGMISSFAWTQLVGLVLPGLYVWGAWKNKQAA